MKILVADDHILFKETLLIYMKASRPKWQVEIASTVAEAESMMNTTNDFDLVMLDIQMPGMNGIDGIKTISSKHPDQTLAILSGVAEDHHIRSAISLGIKAYFPKTMSGLGLIKAIELVVMTGQNFFPMDREGMQFMPSYHSDGYIIPADKIRQRKIYLQNLTTREKQVLRLVAKGLGNKDIARELALKPSTIKVYITKLCKKMDAANRTQIAVLCHQYGLDREE